MRYKLYRIIDVNINRAVEGLRVIEEIARFVLENERFTRQLKQMRTRLRRRASFKERKAWEDVGRKLYPESEAKRDTILDIFLANAKRVQEALRVLEEFSKLDHPRRGKTFKNFRFRLYELEKEMFYALTRRLKLDFDLYVVTDPARGHIETIKQAIRDGVKMVQLRDKAASKKQSFQWAKKIRKLTRKAGVTFIVNDYLDIAKQVNADGVHLGQDDLSKISIAQARKRVGEDKIIGVSTHSLNQALKAQRLGADYISVGPIFSTPSKPGALAVGVGLLHRVLKQIKIPVVAIGGINHSNIYNVSRTGCQRIAVIRAAGEAKKLRQLMKKL